VLGSVLEGHNHTRGMLFGIATLFAHECVHACVRE
jgi:hypothetical protein